MKKISILVIEDNRILREGITAIIRQQPDLSVAGAMGDCTNALQVVRDSKPNIVLLDAGLRNQSCIHLVKVLKKDFEKIKVIVMDLVPSHEDVLLFIQAGVSGFILKDATVDDFLGTIRVVAVGTKVLPPYLTETLFSQIVVKGANELDHSKVIESVRLTKREREIMELVTDGATNKEIAQKLHLSTHTIKSHIHNILEKLALRTRVQIAKYSRNSENNDTEIETTSLL